MSRKFQLEKGRALEPHGAITALGDPRTVWVEMENWQVSLREAGKLYCLSRKEAGCLEGDAMLSATAIMIKALLEMTKCKKSNLF